MLYINKLTSDAEQDVILTGIPNISIFMTLRFLPRVQRWIMNIEYNDFVLNGRAVTTTPNILRQFRNQIPFGIACVAASGLDPFQISDFASQACNLYLLNAADVQTVEQDFFT